MHWTVAKLVEATGGSLLQGERDRPVRGISTDTRRIEPEACFLALRGERFDGHDFLQGALERQATALVVSCRDKLPLLGGEVAVIEVPDTLYALGELARAWRRQYAIPLVGITGSNGKTSSKEMVAGMLSRTRCVLKNQGNFNNLIGVPLTLLALTPEHEAAVVEMGINVPGEMARLAAISQPTVGLITNIHPAHLEGLHSLERILEEKGNLWRSLPAGGLAVVNLDDERLVHFSDALHVQKVTYSLQNPSADVKLAGDVKTEEGQSAFAISLGGKPVPVRLSVLGIHHVQNAVAAAAVAFGMGVSAETIAQALSEHQAIKQRMQIHALKDGRMLIDDTYNANPGSMIAAIQAGLMASCGKPLVAVLGEMRELGAESASLHREVGHKIASMGVSRLIALGGMGEQMVKGARDAGMAPAVCRHAQDKEEALDWLREERSSPAWILVKGSRGMTMERIVEGMLAE